MTKRITWKRYDPHDLHWLLIEAGEERRAQDEAVSDEGWVPVQALHCPYYAPLEGCLGGDWGVILNPESTKFGLLVFEHEWCGCPTEEGEYGYEALHGSGTQTVDEWAVPRSQQKIWRSIKRHKARRAREAS